MTDIIVNDVVSTTVVTAAGGDVVVSTVDAVSVIGSPEVTTVVTTDPSSNVITVTQSDVVLAEQPAVTVLTEGIQGLQGPSGLGAVEVSLEAGETLIYGEPVYISANKFYKSSSASAFGVVGLVTVAAVMGELATATMGGIIGMPAMSPGSTYFLGIGVITTAAPSSGYVVRMGRALSGVSFLMNIEEPVLLA